MPQHGTTTPSMHANYTAGLCRLVEKQTTVKMEAGFVLHCECCDQTTLKPTGLQWNHWGYFSRANSKPVGVISVMCPSCEEWIEIATATAPKGAWNVKYDTDVVHR